MANAIVTKDLLQREVIRLLDKKTIIKSVANLKYQGELRNMGDTVSVQTVPDIFGSMGGIAGSDITINDWTITSQDLVINNTYQSGVTVKNIEQIQSNLDLFGKITNRFSFASAENEDQFVASLVPDANSTNKVNDRSPLTLIATNTYSAITAISRKLQEASAKENALLFINPQVLENIKKENIFDSSTLGLQKRLNGEIGVIDGMRTMVTNNLPHVVKLTLSGQPLNTETFTLTGREADTATRAGHKNRVVTFTWVTAGTAAAAGDISIGASKAASQQNLIDAINGTGTAGASTYVDVATADRNAIKTGFVKAGTSFNASDEINVQSGITLTVTESVTNQTWGSDAVLIFASDSEAINAAFQEDVIEITQEPKGIRKNIIHEKVYGGKIFTENDLRISSNEILVA